MATGFAVIDAESNAKKQAFKDAGGTHLVVPVFWTRMQPTEGGALDTGWMASINAELDDCRAIGLKPILSHSIQYPPAWAVSAIEGFKDQAGNVWDGGLGTGKQVRNWMWTANGRAHVADYLTKVRAGLSPVNRAAVTRVRFGGGYYDELQYPPESLTAPASYWSFGASMQTGTGLAAGLTPCPVPGYVPRTGTDAQDIAWINWYLDGIENFLLWQIITLKAIGWTVPLSVCHPGYGVRQNMTRSQDGYWQQVAAGQDFTRAIGAYKNDPQVWPWSTWINGAEQYPTSPFDTDQAAWAKLYAEAAVRGKHHDLWGENTGGESNADMDDVFANPLANSTPPAGEPVTFGSRRDGGIYRGYRGLMWLNYSTLTGGGQHATLAHYAEKISGFPSTG